MQSFGDWRETLTLAILASQGSNVRPKQLNRSMLFLLCLMAPSGGGCVKGIRSALDTHPGVLYATCILMPSLFCTEAGPTGRDARASAGEGAIFTFTQDRGKPACRVL